VHALRIIVVIITAAALVLNAVIHFELASIYDAIPGALLSQGALFRIQAVVGIVIAVMLMISVKVGRIALSTAVVAAIVAAGGFALVVTTTLIPLDLTAIGLPYLFEPIWFSDKIMTVVVQAVALVTALAAAALAPRRGRRTRPVQP